MDADILLVEDDSSLLRVTSLALRGEGFRVTESGDGREALAVFGREPLDLVLLDVMLPVVSAKPAQLLNSAYIRLTSQPGRRTIGSRRNVPRTTERLTSGSALRTSELGQLGPEDA